MVRDRGWFCFDAACVTAVDRLRRSIVDRCAHHRRTARLRAPMLAPPAHSSATPSERKKSNVRAEMPHPERARRRSAPRRPTQTTLMSNRLCFRFFVRFQSLARAYTHKPVFMSSLVHLPALTCAFNVTEKVAIFTANSETLTPMKDLIKDECGVEADEERYVFVGCQVTESSRRGGGWFGGACLFQTVSGMAGVFQTVVVSDCFGGCAHIAARFFAVFVTPTGVCVCVWWPYAYGGRAVSRLTTDGVCVRPSSAPPGIGARSCVCVLVGARRTLYNGQDVPGFEAVAAGGKVDVEAVTPGMVAKAKAVMAEHPTLRCILMECTELPPYSDALRHATGLPVFDAITCCDFFIGGVTDNPRFGLNDWHSKWDGKQEEYTFGENLDAEDKARTHTDPRTLLLRPCRGRVWQRAERSPLRERASHSSRLVASVASTTRVARCHTYGSVPRYDASLVADGSVPRYDASDSSLLVTNSHICSLSGGRGGGGGADQDGERGQGGEEGRRYALVGRAQEEEGAAARQDDQQAAAGQGQGREDEHLRREAHAQQGERRVARRRAARLRVPARARRHRLARLVRTAPRTGRPRAPLGGGYGGAVTHVRRRDAAAGSVVGGP